MGQLNWTELKFVMSKTFRFWLKNRFPLFLILGFRYFIDPEVLARTRQSMLLQGLVTLFLFLVGVSMIFQSPLNIKNEKQVKALMKIKKKNNFLFKHCFSLQRHLEMILKWIMWRRNHWQPKSVNYHGTKDSPQSKPFERKNFFFYPSR